MITVSAAVPAAVKAEAAAVLAARDAETWPGSIKPADERPEEHDGTADALRPG